MGCSIFPNWFNTITSSLIFHFCNVTGQAEALIMETNTKTNKLEGTNPLRRSSRQAKPSVTAEVKAVIRPTNAKIMEEPRRNPKRKASETPKHTTNLPDNLLEEALAPLSAKDIEDWEGWIELESEPVG